MNISLTSELDEWVLNKVKSGMYKSSSEVIREGLRLLLQRDLQKQAMLDELRTELLIGCRQLDAGKSQVFDDSLIRTIKEQGRQRSGL
ncbi:MAG: type II toxin-antitoxin system ParD family antitoxin [Proteobacteria bacterium]|nr:type II toxin-antitoxin system ParD family antitoxin [Pseudomonadota bacterium]MBU1709946.1 type II toxin-antitoxin system ParD family antitoxin [Pseudomonadota bacterium]